MERSISVKRKKGPGRPATGLDPVMGVRVSPQLCGEILKWAETQPGELTLSEATRCLVEIGLKAPRPPATVDVKPAHKARAAELAAQAIDGLIDPNTSPDERDRRSSRLTRGPLEFREARVDQNK